MNPVRFVFKLFRFIAAIASLIVSGGFLYLVFHPETLLKAITPELYNAILFSLFSGGSAAIYAGLALGLLFEKKLEDKFFLKVMSIFMLMFTVFIVSLVLS